MNTKSIKAILPVLSMIAAPTWANELNIAFVNWLIVFGLCLSVWLVGGPPPTQAADLQTQTPQVASTTSGNIQWIEKAPMPVTVASLFAYAATSDKIYIIGGDLAGWSSGSTTVQRYTPATDTWEVDTNHGGMLAPLPQPRSAMDCGVISDKIHCVGGWQNGTYRGEHFIYDPISNTWSTGPSIPQYPIGQFAATLNNKMYVFGGWWGSYWNAVYEYSEATGWTSKAAMPTARNSGTTAVYNSKIYAIGGEGGQPIQRQPLDVVEMYDPQADTWTTGLARMPVPSNYLGSSGAPVARGIIYVLGPGNTAYGYNPDANSWQTFNSMPGSATGITAFNDAIYAIGPEHTYQGNTHAGGGPRIAKWQQTTALPQPSASAWFTGKPMPIINGRAYLVGGQKATPNPLLTAVYYSTINANGTLGPWVKTTPLPKLYEDYAVVSIGNYVYLINGADGIIDVDYAPILPNGRIGTWTPTEPLDPSRQNFAAAAYGNFIYVSGGNSGGTISQVKYTSVKPDGSLNPWQITTALPVPLEGHGMVATRGRLYVVAPSGAVYYAVINPADGTVGNWTPTTTLPAPVSGYSTFELNGYLYLVGGNPNSTYYAQIQGDGTLVDKWQPTTLLPAIRMGARIGAAGNSVYVAGGYNGSSYVKTVYYSHLAAPVGGSATGLQLTGVSCVNSTTKQTVNVGISGTSTSWNCEDAGLQVNSGNGIKMMVTGSANLTAPVGGSATGLKVSTVSCVNNTTRQTVSIDMRNVPPSWNCEQAGLQVKSGNRIKMTVTGSAE